MSDNFDRVSKLIADVASAGYADDALIGDSIGLYDSDTNETLRIEKRVVISTPGGSVSLLYTTARRGRICQLRDGNRHIHYFIDEPSSQRMIREDEKCNGVSLEIILANALADKE